VLGNRNIRFYGLLINASQGVRHTPGKGIGGIGCPSRSGDIKVIGIPGLLSAP